MATYSVYNIHIDNNLSFTPGPTAGYVLAIDANGNTYWAAGGSGGGGTGSGSSGSSGTSGTSGVSTKLYATSSTTLSLGLGTQSFYIPYKVDFIAGQPVYIKPYSLSGVSENMTGYVWVNDTIGGGTGYLYIVSTAFTGTGTYSLWEIAVGGSGGGVSGSSGTSGSSGINGTSGTSGINGTSGSSGTSGISPSANGSFGITIDGAGSVITTGLKGYIQVPYSGTITGWTLLADQSGSIVIDVWKDTVANFPPTIADTIAGSEKPTLSSQQINEDNALSTWTTSVSAGDIMAFNVDSASTITRATLSIKITKS